MSAYTLARGQRRLVLLYRARAFEALARARQARHDGDTLAQKGFLDEARFWKRGAADWARKAQRIPTRGTTP